VVVVACASPDKTSLQTFLTIAFGREDVPA
jgi:hypothetical protein